MSRHFHELNPRLLLGLRMMELHHPVSANIRDGDLFPEQSTGTVINASDDLGSWSCCSTENRFGSQELNRFCQFAWTVLMRRVEVQRFGFFEWLRGITFVFLELTLFVLAEVVVSVKSEERQFNLCRVI